MIAVRILIAGAFVLLSMQTGQAVEPQVSGLWKLASGKLTVDVQPCQGVKLCGKIAALEHKLRPDGTPQLDELNPNPALRSRKVIGLQVFDGLTPTGPGTWKGRIYNADDGHYYTAYAKFSGTSLQVKGCWGPFCKNLEFSRAK